MHKERQAVPVTSNRNRVSPYPLRSCRSTKQKETESSPLVSEESSVSEWEDVRCVICLEQPHNAILLQCSSFSRGCRAYMCDTSSRHSNCFKQYRRNNNDRIGSKTLKCPYCRGEVHGTVKSTSARRFLNATPRCCSVDKCHFSGTYSQLKTHLKAEHPGFISPVFRPWEQLRREREAEYTETLDAAEHPGFISPMLRPWNQLRRERDAEYVETLEALRRWEAEERPSLGDPLFQLPQHHQHPLVHLSFDTFIQRVRSQASAADYPHGTMHPRWNH